MPKQFVINSPFLNNYLKVIYKYQIQKSRKKAETREKMGVL